MDPKVQEILTAAGATGGNRVWVDKAYALTETGEVVAGDDPTARFVLVGAGGNLPADFAKDNKVKGSDKPIEKPAAEAPAQPFAVQQDAQADKPVISIPPADAPAEQKPADNAPPADNADKSAAAKK